MLDNDVINEDVIKTIKQTGGKILSRVEVFDYYEGNKIEENKKSIAYNLYFESKERTLTEEEINPILDKIIEMVIKHHKAVLRDK